MPYVARHRAEDAMFQGLGVWNCQACGSHFAEPCPTEAALARYYRGTYRADGRNVAAVDGFPFSAPWYLSRGLAVARLVAQSLGAGLSAVNVLDIGAGYGHVAYALRHAFGPCAHVTAVEADPACQATLRTVADRIDADGPLPEVLRGLQPRRFNAVLLLHVLEHFADPVALLSRVAPLVAVDGVLVVEVPHCPPRRVCWYNTNTPHVPHLVFFTVTGLHRVLERSGFRVCHADTYGPVIGRDGSCSLAPALSPDAGRGELDLPYPVFAEPGPGRLFLRAVARPAPLG